MRAVWLACVAVIGLAPGYARADEPAPSDPEPPAKEAPKPEAAPIEKPGLDTPIVRPIRTREIVVDIPGERSTNNKLALGAIAVGGLLAGSLGLYWHLDSRSAANDVTATMPTGNAWTAHDQSLLDRADSSRTRATVAYTVGGLFITAAIVGLIVTEPKTERSVIHPNATVSVSGDGAMVGGAWRF
jgi:hypothetical protein